MELSGFPNLRDHLRKTSRAPNRRPNLDPFFYLADASLECPQGKISLLLVNHERWRKPNGVFARPEHQQSLREGQGYDVIAEVRSFLPGFLVADDFDADHQPFAANVAHDSVPLAPPGQATENELAHAPCVFEILPLDETDRRKRRGDAHGVPAEGRGMCAWSPVHHTRTRDGHAQRHA